MYRAIRVYFGHVLKPFCNAEKGGKKYMKNDIHETGAQRGVELAESVHENRRIADDIFIGS